MAGQEGILLALILGFSVLGLAASLGLARWVLKQDTGNDAMRAVSDAIKEGAEAFMKRQFRTIRESAPVGEPLAKAPVTLIEDGGSFDVRG